jgi:hypothetical protein
MGISLVRRFGLTLPSLAPGAVDSPDDISGLVLWLDADDSSTLSLSGSNVTQWDDKSGSANHAVQATSAQQPVLVTAEQNGRDVLRFTPTGVNSDDHVRTGSSVWTGNATRTMVCVYRDSRSPKTLYKGTVAGASDGPDPGGWFVIQARTASVRGDPACSARGGGLDVMYGPPPDASWKIAAAVYDGTSIKVYRNGVQVGESQSTGVLDTQDNGFFVGCLYVVGDFADGLDGDVGEVICYNRALTETELADLTSVLSTKWDIAVGSVISPSDVTGLKLWLDADDNSTITLDGTAVTTWESKDADARTFSQATASLQPSLVSNELNGKPAVVYANDQLISDDLASVWKWMHEAGHNSFFMVMKVTAGDSAVTSIFGNNRGSGNNPGVVWQWDDRGTSGKTNALRFFSGNGPSGTSTIENFDNGILTHTETAYFIVHVVNEMNASTASQRSFVYLTLLGEGREHFNNNTLTQAPSTSDPTYTLMVGGAGDAGDLIGAIAEMLYYDGELTPLQLAEVYVYLAQKWGFTE